MSTGLVIAQAVLLLEHQQTDKQTDVTNALPHTGDYTAGVDNNLYSAKISTLITAHYCPGARTGNLSNV